MVHVCLVRSAQCIVRNWCVYGWTSFTRKLNTGLVLDWMLRVAVVCISVSVSVSVCVHLGVCTCVCLSASLCLCLCLYLYLFVWPVDDKLGMNAGAACG
jgi:hypothetical protein